MIKAAFFDVDGTLYSHETKSVPESAKQALTELQEGGIKIFLATGRHFVEIDELGLNEIPFDGYVMLVGQICTDSERNMIYGNSIGSEAGKYLFRAFKEGLMPVIMVVKERLYLNFVDENVVKGQEAVSSPIPEIDEYRGEDVYQFTCFGGKELEEELIRKLPECKVTRWSPYGVDIVSKDGGKDVGISKLLEHYNILPEEMIAFGDAENDIEMLKFAGIGVAMGNAVDALKKVADYITTDINEDGIWNACKHYKLI